MQHSNKEILKLYFLLEQLPDDAVGVWEIHNDKKAKVVSSSLGWIIESLVLAGAKPVHGAPKESNYDWIKTSEFGQVPEEIAQNITLALQSAVKTSPIEVDKLMYGVWFAIPELYEYDGSPLNSKYQNLKRNKAGKTLEEVIIQNMRKFVDIIYRGDEVVQILSHKISLKEIMPELDDKTFTQTPAEAEIYIRRNLCVILQMAKVVKKCQNKWMIDNELGDSPETIIKNIISQWKQSNEIPDIIFSFPQFQLTDL